MSLSNVLKGMKEGFPKDQVVDDLNILRQDLATYTIPMFQQAEKDFGTRTFKSKYAENFHKHLKNEVRKISQKNFISPVLKALDMSWNALMFLRSWLKNTSIMRLSLTQ